MDMNTLSNALNWRYAVKKMTGEKVSQDKVDKILHAANMAPTSSGLQPFRVIAVTNPELKARIQPVASGQTQILDCSHLLIFAAWDNYTNERIRDVFAYTNQQRGLPFETPGDHELMLKSMFIGRPAEENFQHAARQAYIGFGMAIAQAALLEVDATPMEGFNGPELDKLLGLDTRGLRSVTLLTLGFRDTPNDWLVNLKKVRTPMEDFVIHMD